MKLQRQWVAIGLLITLSAGALQAAPNPKVNLSELFKISIQHMVQDVHQAQAPAQKRKILNHYLTSMDAGLEKMKYNQGLTDSDRKIVNGLQTKIHTNYSDFYGPNNSNNIPNADLDSFADYVQQDWEQADNEWGGGVYLSGGALLVLLILILIFH